MKWQPKCQADRPLDLRPGWALLFSIAPDAPNTPTGEEHERRGRGPHCAPNLHGLQDFESIDAMPWFTWLDVRRLGSRRPCMCLRTDPYSGVVARRPGCVYLSTENDAVQLRKEAPGPYVLYIIIDFYFVTHQTIAERASVHSCHSVFPSSAGRSPKLDHHFVAVSCSVLADAENIRTCKISEALKRHRLVCVPI